MGPLQDMPIGSFFHLQPNYKHRELYRLFFCSHCYIIAINLNDYQL